MPNIPYSIAAVIVLTILLGLAGFEIKHEIGKNAALTTELTTAKASLKQIAEAQKAVSEIDTTMQAKTDEIKADQIKLDSAVATRTVILRVPAKCVQSTPAATEQPDESRVELDPTFRPTHSALRAGIREREAKIGGLQDYIEKVCLRM